MGRDRQEASLSAERATGALFAALFACVVGGPPRIENDVYWHLAIGRILAGGTFPRTDPLGFTTEGLAWSPPEWASELVGWGLYAGAGLFGLALARLAVLFLLGALLFRRARLLGAPPLGALVVLALTCAPASVHLPMRPLVLGHLFTALVLAELAAMRAGRPHRVALLPLLFVVWANLHPSWPVGLAFVGLAAFSWLALPRVTALGRIGMRPEPLSPQAARTLALASGLSLFSPLVRPDGLDGALYPFVHVIGLGDQASEILEWFPLDPTSPLQLAAVFALALALVLLLRRRGDPFELLVTALAMALVLSYQRFVPLAAIVAAPTLAALAPRSAALDRALSRSVAALGAVLLLALAVPTPSSLAAGEAASFPLGPVAALADRPPGERTFATFETGGLVAFRHEGRRVYIDSRFDLSARAGVFREYLRLRHGDDVLATFDARGIDSALVPTPEADENFVAMRAALVDAGWREVARDPLASLFVRPLP